MSSSSPVIRRKRRGSASRRAIITTSSSPASKKAASKKAAPKKAAPKKAAPKKHTLPELPLFPSDLIAPNGVLDVVAHPMDALIDDLHLGDYIGTSDRLRKRLLGLSWKELIALKTIKGLKRPPKFGPVTKTDLYKQDHPPEMFRAFFEWEQLYPAWYLRKRLWAQTLRHALGSALSYQAHQRGSPPAKDYESDPKWMPKWYKWAPPRVDKRILEDWESLTGGTGFDIHQVHRPPAPGYEEWGNPALDRRHTKPEAELRRMAQWA